MQRCFFAVFIDLRHSVIKMRKNISSVYTYKMFALVNRFFVLGLVYQLRVQASRTYYAENLQ